MKKNTSENRLEIIFKKMAIIIAVSILLLKGATFILSSILINFGKNGAVRSSDGSEMFFLFVGFAWWFMASLEYMFYIYLMFLLIFFALSTLALSLYRHRNQKMVMYSDIALAAFALFCSWALVDQSGVGKLKYSGETVSHYFPEKPERALANAAAKGDIAAIDAAMAAGADINYESDISDITPLFWAMHASSTKGFDKLLDLGADPMRGDRVIAEAASGPDPVYLRMLLEHGFDPNRTSERFDEPLIFEAIDGGRWPQFRLLLKHCYNLNWSNEWGQTAAWNAVMRYKLDMAVELIEQGQNFQLERVALAIQQQGGSLQDEQFLEALILLLDKRGINLPIDKGQVPKTIGQVSVPPAYAESCVEQKPKS